MCGELWIYSFQTNRELLFKKTKITTMNFDNFEIEERIERYLSQKMTKNEESEFEMAMAQSPELQEQVELSKLIKIYHEHPEIPDVRKLIQATMPNQKAVEIPIEFKQEEKKAALKVVHKVAPQEPNHSIIRRIIPIIALAASVILAIIMIPYFSNSGDLFSNNFSPAPKLKITFDNSDIQVVSNKKPEELNKQIEDIKKALNSEQYETALDLLQELFDNQWLKDELFIYRANALLGKGDIEQAIAEYEQLLENNTELQAVTKWYLALAHIKNKETEKAKLLLEELSSLNDKIYTPKRKNY